MTHYLHSSADFPLGAQLLMVRADGSKAECLTEILAYKDRKEENLPPLLTIRTLDNNQEIQLRQHNPKRMLLDWRALRPDPMTGDPTFSSVDGMGLQFCAPDQWVPPEQLKLSL